MYEVIDIREIKQQKYSGLVKILTKTDSLNISQIGYLLFKKGDVVEGYLKEKRETLEGNNALKAIEAGNFSGFFDPPMTDEEESRQKERLISIALEKGVLDDLDKEF
ncbi:hypothetical protein IPdc08_01767 [archaeon]|nr:hypothetical protein IPdc08_01767 [archaeon]